MCSTTKLPCEARRPLPSFEAVCQRSQEIPGFRGGEPPGLDRVEFFDPHLRARLLRASRIINTSAGGSAGGLEAR